MRIIYLLLTAAVAQPVVAQDEKKDQTAAAAPVAPAQPAAQAPLLVQPQQAVSTAVLPANTELTLALNNTITTKGNRWSEGDTFDLTVTHDVMLGNYVVIPKGSRGMGRITWLTNKGAFGKSGKMEIDLEYVELSGRRIPISGHYRQEGEGNTVGTVAGVVAVGVFAGFVTGKSGTIPQGRELVARTKEDLPVAFAGPAPVQAAPVVVAQPVQAAPVVQATAPVVQATAPAPTTSAALPPAPEMVSTPVVQPTEPASTGSEDKSHEDAKPN